MLVQITIPTIDSLIEPYKHYPKAIRHAILLADSHPSLHQLTRAFRRVLKALVTRCDRRDACKTIMARLDHLAREASVCEKTVQRALAMFRRMGLLRQMTDGRDDTGLFTFREYKFTPTMAEILDLPGDLARHQRTEMSADHIKVIVKEDQPGIPVQAEEPKKQIELPLALAEAGTALGIKDTGMAKLRGEAHEAGHRLEDIVAVARERLLAIGASGGRAFRYLQTMIGKPSDYAGRAAQTARVASEAAETTQRMDRAQKYRHRRFIGPAGLQIRIFDGTAEAILGNGQFMTIVGQDMAQIYDRIESGFLTEVTA